MEEKVNLSFFKEFFELLSPPDYSKMLINTKNPDENKEIVAEIKNRISDLKDKIREMSKTEKESVDETLKIIERIVNYNKNAQKNFLVSKVNKKKSELKLIKENQNQKLIEQNKN